jgi:hypothetical protein
MRQGDFSRYLAATGRPAFELRDPLTGQLFPGNVIPRSRWNPSSVKAVDRFYPVPNVATANPDVPFANADATRYGAGSNSQLFFRVDQKITDKNTAGFTYSQRPITSIFSEGASYGTLTSTPDGLDIASQIASARQFGWNDTHVISPTIVNEVRIGYYRQPQIFNAKYQKTVGDITDALGIDLGSGADYRKKLRQAPQIYITGYDRIGSVYSDDQRLNQLWQFRDNLSIQRGRHSFKVGYDHRFRMDDRTNASGAAGGQWDFTGRFTGDAFADFILGLPQTTQRFTPSLPRRFQRFNDFGLFVQDAWKAGDRLTLNLGVRFDRMSPQTELQGTYFNFNPKTGALVFPDQKSIGVIHPAFPANFKRETVTEAGFPEGLTEQVVTWSPRFGFAYRLTDQPSTVLRGGYGIFQVWSGWLNNDFALLNTGGPFGLTEAFNNTITNGVPLVTLDRPFPAGLGQVPATISVSATNPKIGLPLTQQWNLTVERQVYRDWAARLSYVGARSTQLGFTSNLNRPAASLIPFTASRLLYPGYLNINYKDKGGNSIYHAMQFGVNHRFSSGLLLESLFQWVNEISDVAETGIDSGFAALPDPYCRRGCESAKGLLDSLDFRANFIYELPLGRGKRWGANLGRAANGFAGGWSLAGLVDIRNGRPETVNFSGIDTSNTNLQGGRADVVPGCNARSGDGKSALYLNIACFAVPQRGTFGNASRSVFRLPGSWDVSGSVYKYFPLYRESVKLRINGVFSNLFNHPTWREVGNNISVPASFGKLLTQGSYGRWAGSRSINLQAQIQW